MDENIKYELAEAEKLEVIDNAGLLKMKKINCNGIALVCHVVDI